MIGRPHHDEDRHPVRKILQSLPKIPATHGFEARLRKRIADERERPVRPSLWDWVLMPARVPAMALSLTAIVAAGVFSYYTFVRTGVTPVQQTLQPPTLIEPKAASTQSPPTEDLMDNRQADRLTGSSRESVARRQSTRPAPVEDAAAREAAQEELFQRGLMKEVGHGTAPAQANRAFGIPETAQGKSSQNVFQILLDSAARVDSLRADSLRRMELR